jgi:hypothetical protein
LAVANSRASQSSSGESAFCQGGGVMPVAKWRQRVFSTTSNGAEAPRSTVLSPDGEGIVVAFRKHTLLELDDYLCALQATIPNLTRSSVHRCLKRRGISRLPEIAGDKVSLQRVSKTLRLLSASGIQLGCAAAIDLNHNTGNTCGIWA